MFETAAANAAAKVMLDALNEEIVALRVERSGLVVQDMTIEQLHRVSVLNRLINERKDQRSALEVELSS